MFNETAKAEIVDILSVFDDNSVLALAKTVTNGLLKNNVRTREEAIETIILYSIDVVSLLRRKAITREVLFSYFHRKKIPVNLPATKNNLIERLATLWNVEYMEEDQCGEGITLNPIAALAEQFVDWFYSLINNAEFIGPEHFFPDAKIKVNTSVNNEFTSEFIENDPQEICKLLYIKKTQHNLYFNPNLTNEGVQGRLDPHGLVLVLACGTLHVNNVCVGVFEQVFALTRDPSSENNWKIKNTELNLKSESVFGTPKLCNSSLTSNLLTLPV